MMIIEYDDKLENKLVEEIFCLITNYMNKGKDIDIEFLRIVVSIFIYYKQVNDYVNNVKINNKSKLLGSYSHVDKDISINLVKILKDINTYKIFNQDEKNFYKYLKVVKTLLHELEHANQNKLKIMNNSLEGKILIKADTLCDKLFFDYMSINKTLSFKRILLINKIDNYYKKYRKYYEFSPNERLAFLKADVTSLKLLEKFEYSMVHDYEEFKYNSDRINPYITHDNPTKYYIEKVNKKYDGWNEIESLCNNLSFEDRLLLGLEISIDEYRIIHNKLKVGLDKMEENMKKLSLK